MMTLCGLVLILVVLLAGVSGLAVWKWREAEALRRQVSLQGGPLPTGGADVTVDGPGGTGAALDEFLLDENERFAQQAARMVGVCAENPWPLVALLYPEPEEIPPPAEADDAGEARPADLLVP
ncbi:MAG TPA: hypothetical protein VNK04_06320 [Gemmataceae bacterium]|nr:hypothetical protein [Gemmataceae bacterium]